MAAIGIRELKNNLSRYIRRVEKGERIDVTIRGRVVAQLIPAGISKRTQGGRNWYADMVARGLIRPAAKQGPLRFRPIEGTAGMLIDADRGE